MSLYLTTSIVSKASQSQASLNTVSWFETSFWNENFSSFKKCFKPNCQKKASVMCECTGKCIFSCNKHFAKHAVQNFNQETHNLIPIVALLNEVEIQNTMENIKHLNKALNSISLGDNQLEKNKELCAFLSELGKKYGISLKVV